MIQKLPSCQVKIGDTFDGVPKYHARTVSVITQVIGCGVSTLNPMSNGDAKSTFDQIKIDGIPPERLAEMQLFAMGLRKKHPGISPQTMANRVCKQFNIQINELPRRL